ncbi:MmgE/PrpD family protein [Amycolatopsis pithecellobii]|uniref:MmgE/PrpD family protein n=1 Tax=Amycolatopsis pithecellobii TaxID=664692 RepID=A0A6N7Z115_9PSEU|nr:MmgE/PrpD family protein [Amycolatopsis pithecellobii]MTD53310.1 MmgE/PrpD family protein [Amycolatopsis pithecellobii]
MTGTIDSAVATRPVTRELATFAAELRYENLPPEVIAMAKRCVLDSLGCGIYGSATPWVDAVARTVGLLGQAATASTWGRPLKADPLGAVMINGTAAQGYELDDCHDQSMSHYGAGVVPAVLAVAEAMGPFDGKQIVTAVVAGYEVGTRVGNTVSPSAFHRGFHPCGLTSTFASAAAISTLLGLDAGQYVNALGLAGSQAAGLMAAQYGAMAKRFHSGKAAQNGIIAALAAREGLTGVRDVLEAPYGGFCSTYAAEYDLDYAVRELGEHWEILRNGFKQYSSLASSQTTVDALRAIRARAGITADEVESVLVETTEMVYVHCGWPYVPNGETIAAQMNLPYTAAVTLIDGTAFIDGYTDDRLADPQILALADRVKVVVAPDLDALGKDEMRAVRVTLTTKSGQEHTENVVYRSGHWKNPLSDEDIAAKFRNLATRVITSEAADEIQRVVLDLDNQSDPVATLARRAGEVR